jgi:hypothetical protein
LAFAENVDRGFVIQTQLHHPAQHTIVKRRRHLGFVTCEAPFLFVHRMATLDHLTGGGRAMF